MTGAATALIDQAKRLPDELRKSLTWDRGKEMAQKHQPSVLKRVLR